ncbi:MAG: lysophospholipase [Rhodoferax sp.]|nr:lysophospholipase [Rhodoferax sp.]MBJ7467292.1 lysophospholipase [Rhodoferax sp.]
MNDSSTLSKLSLAPGLQLTLRDWPLADPAAVRAQVLIVHGLGEHSGRYEHVAQQLNSWGYAVRSFDLWGHGLSDGERGSMRDEHALLDDLAAVVDHTRKTMQPGQSLVLLGHSLGGLVAARFVSLRMRPIDALVLSSPALDPGLNAFQKVLLATLPGIAPNLRVGNGLQVKYLSHDPAVVAAYQADPLVHDRICARLALFIAQEGREVLAAAPRWNTPTLLLFAGQDKLVSPQGSRDFLKLAPGAIVQSLCFEALFHEIFNEAEAGGVFTALQQWLLVGWADLAATA